ncbi:MoaD/ThiS family protein [Nocardioides aestuarii]|uniref:Molybdopterin synthase sulfur carrier subunit n=1 Tax=Nocardioides aestuarii TaxID=252231 RepID=A0ABW4TJ74_9ACTN
MSTASVTVRYWAAARAAAGTDHDDLPVEGETTLADVVRRVVAAHPEGRLAGVLEVCSVLVGDRPVATEDPVEVVIRPGDEIQFLPPFAGG